MAENLLTKEFWDYYMQVYERWLSRCGPYLAFQDMILREATVPLDATVIDAGTGPGLFITRLCDAGHRGRVYGIDASPSACNAARERHKWNLNIDIREGNLETLAFDRLLKADVVFCINVLYALADQEAFIRKLYDMLSSGGKVVLTAVSNPDQRLLAQAQEEWIAGLDADDRAQIEPYLIFGELLLRMNVLIAQVMRSEGRARTSIDLVRVITDVGFVVDKIVPNVYAGTSTLVVARKP